MFSSVDLYSIFTFEPLHNLHLRISNLVKGYTVGYLYSHRLIINGVRIGCSLLVTVRTRIMRACSPMLAIIEKKENMRVVKIVFGKVGGRSRLSRILTKIALKAILEGRDYKAIYKVFPFVAAFIDRCSEKQKTAPLKGKHAMYGLIVIEVTGDGERATRDVQELSNIEEKVRAFKKDVVDGLHDHCNSGLYTLKFHLLDHLGENMRRFGPLSVPDASLFECFNVYGATGTSANFAASEDANNGHGTSNGKGVSWGVR